MTLSGTPRAVRLHPAGGWLLAFAVLAAVVLLRLALDPLLGGNLPLVTLYGATAVAVWLAGWLAAATVSLVGYVACSYLFMAPRGELLPRTVTDGVGLVAYLFTSLLVIAIGEAMHRAQRRDASQGRLLQVTLASIGDGVITTDVDGRVTFLNTAAERLTGWTDREARARPLDEVFRILAEEGRLPLESPAVRALREGRAVGLRNHTVLIGMGGEEYSIDDSAAPIEDEAGRVSGCVLVFRDVTSRRRWEIEGAERLSAARLLAAIVESSDDAIVSKSLDGIVRSWNAGAERLFGYRADEAIGRHISLIIPPERMVEEDQIIASLKAGKRVDHFETERRHRNGATITVSLTISPIKDAAGTVVGASKIARDVTERKRLENDLRRLAEDLADADRRKDEFLATLSHELRNPLAPMRSMLEVLKTAAGDAPRRTLAVETIDRQLDHLVRLIDDLLDLSRVTHNRVELRLGPVDLAAVLEDAVRATESLACSAAVSITVELPADGLTVHGDAVRLVQIFGNLLNNGCKYTPPGGTITVRARREGDTALVTVTDTGVGIPQDKLEHVFEMFARLDRPLEQQQGGLGIGLTLVKRLVELHGGTISATSPGEGLGSSFIVRLPLDLGRGTDAAVSAPEPQRAASRRRILIVDDNRDAAESLALLLRIHGHETYEADDGEGALAAAALHRPEVVLLDIGLPTLDGYEVCRRLRAEPWGRKIVIVALTGWGQEEDRRKSAAAGFDGHLVKPVEFTELVALLARAASARGSSLAAENRPDADGQSE